MKRITRLSLIGICSVTATLLLWTILFTPVNAINIQGHVAATENLYVVQRAHAGIVQQIFVKNGMQVKQGDLLMTFKDTKAHNTRTLSNSDYWALLSTKARLSAELHHKSKITFPEALTQVNHPKAQEIMNVQQEMFKINQKKHSVMRDIYQNRIKQLNTQIQGKKAQLKSIKTQMHFLQKELEDVKILAKKRLVKESRLLALYREIAVLEGQQGEAGSQIAQLEQKIGEIHLEVVTLNYKQHTDLLNQLHETQKTLREMVQGLNVSNNRVNRDIIRAPISGTILNLNVHAKGAVIQPDEPLLSIKPLSQGLIIKARLDPAYIEDIHPGMKAKISFIDKNRRQSPTLSGQVTQVSLKHLKASEDLFYYEMMVEILSGELKKLKNNLIQPGTPATVTIYIKSLSI